MAKTKTERVKAKKLAAAWQHCIKQPMLRRATPAARVILENVFYAGAMTATNIFDDAANHKSRETGNAMVEDLMDELLEFGKAAARRAES